MSITDKLREAFDDCTVMAGVENDFECVYITKTAAMRLLDEIDAEHEKELAEQYASLTVDMEPMTDENMAKHGWVRLPKDADGVLGNDGVGRTNDGVDEIDELKDDYYTLIRENKHVCDQLAQVKDYNAKLRKQGEWLFNKTLELATKNDKLRKLAGALFDCSRDGLYTDELPCQWCDLKSKEVCERMAKELGVIE